MKRSSHEVAGGPKLRDLRPAVAGRPESSAGSDMSDVSDVAFAPGTGTREPAMTPATEDTNLLADFADFMSAEEELDLGVLPPPDLTFKERLRRRLWRTYVMSYLRGGGETSH